jgi:flagellar basal-body rod modification protein FlgD
MMDPISAIGTAPTTTADRYSELSSQDFLKIMFTELGNQDPMQPSDSKALLDQLSSLRNIQSSMDLGSKLEGLVTQNELNSAAALIGKYVSGINEDNEPVVGAVFSVSRTADGAVLNLYSGDRVSMKQLSEVVNPPEDEDES